MGVVSDLPGPVVADTNVLVYAVDPHDDDRRRRAQQVLGELGGRGDWLLPVQVMAEFASVALRKLHLPPGDVRDHLATHRRAARRVLALRTPLVDEALRGVEAHGLSYYDAQIWAAARLAGAAVLLSEDLQTGRDLEGVRVLDPFAGTARGPDGDR